MKNQTIIIPFVSLKEGIHYFDFEVDSTFFEQFDFSIIQNASFTVKVTFEKKVNMFNLYFDFDGQVIMPCDRCTEEMTTKLNGNEELIIKFGEDEFNQTDEIKIIPFNEHELDITNEVYEYIHLLLPNKIEHLEEEDCNQDVIEKLIELTTKKESEVIDPRWAELNKLKDKSE